MDVTAYDFVVGAGSAGCAVAARLSENPAHRVLLLEAGPRDDRLEIRIPAAFSKLFRSDLDWSYDTEPQSQLNGRRIYWPRGKVLGGSSSINAMMWIRWFPEDYAAWTDSAGESWSWNALLPYFRKVERVHGASDDDTDTAGAITIEAQRSPRSATAAFLEAARETELDEVVANGPARECHPDDGQPAPGGTVQRRRRVRPVTGGKPRFRAVAGIPATSVCRAAPRHPLGSRRHGRRGRPHPADGLEAAAGAGRPSLRRTSTRAA